MDKSKEYIEMCEKATEIQEKWIPCIGDDYMSKVFSQPLMLTSNKFRGRNQKAFIWLPHQDQLQKIVENQQDFGIGHNVNMFHNFVFTKYSIDFRANDVFGSMEQIWFAFVMKEKYNKTWNGKEWVK